MKIFFVIVYFFLCSVAVAAPLKQRRGLVIPEIKTYPPSDIADLEVWLDASKSASISIGTGVSQWSAQSPTLINATQGVGANQPAYSLNDTITVDTTDFLSITGSLDTFDVFFVGTSNPSWTPWRTPLYATAGAGSYPFLLQPNTNNIGVFNGGFIDSGQDWPAGAKRQARLRSNSRAIQVSVERNTLSSVLTTFASSPFPTTLGNHPTNGHPFNRLHEVIIFDRLLTDAEVLKIQNYLSKKWRVE